MVETLVRRPAVAGRFYPGDRESLREEVNSYLHSERSPNSDFLPGELLPGESSRESFDFSAKQETQQINTSAALRAIGCIVPHAGYMYSGHVAGAVFRRIDVPELCVVLCPNHTGIGQALAIMSEGEWETPLGNVPIDTAFAAQLKERFPALQEDAAAHRAEHAIEVELPFLLARQPNLRFVPLALGTGRLEVLDALGVALADVISAWNERMLIVASSDMNHYENDVVTRTKDHQAIERILRLDARGLHEVVTQQAISMCGYGPAVTMLTAARKLGAKSAELVKYATSGDVSGDRDMVVGYAGVVVA